MRTQRQLIALVLLTALLCALFASSAYAALEAGHECVGEDCPVCAIVARLNESRRGLALALAALCAAIFTAAERLLPRNGTGRALPVAATLIARKIRMND